VTNPPDWRLRHLAREAVLNLISRGSRGFVALTLAVLAGSAAAAFADLEGRNLQSSLEDLNARGRNVLVVSSSSDEAPARISRASCEQIAEMVGVLRAGAVVSDGRQKVFPYGSEVQVFRVSTTLIPELSESSSLVGAAITTQVTGTPVTLLVDGVHSAGMVGDKQPPGIDVNSGLSLAAGPADGVSPNCVVVLASKADSNAMAALILAHLKSEGSSLIAVPALRESVDLRQAFLDRPSRFLPLALGALLGAAIGLINLGRSSELAVYRFSGTSRTAFLVLVTLEASLVAAVASLAFVACSTVLGLLGTDLTSESLRGIGLGATTVLASLPFAMVLALKEVSDLAKDR
jgi:hypothetical protein